jgi:hypothetical protein
VDLVERGQAIVLHVCIALLSPGASPRAGMCTGNGNRDSTRNYQHFSRFFQHRRL